MFQKLSLLCAALALAGCATTGGSTGTATIKRDSYGVPHVYANDVRGLFYGYGYVVAEDRLFQMEMAKRSGEFHPNCKKPD